MRGLLIALLATGLVGSHPRPHTQFTYYFYTDDGLMHFDLVVPGWLWGEVEDRLPPEQRRSIVPPKMDREVTEIINDSLTKLESVGGCPHEWEIYRGIKAPDRSMYFIGECVDDFKFVRR